MVRSQVDFAQFKGTVVYAVNVASRCVAHVWPCSILHNIAMAADSTPQVRRDEEEL